MVKIASFQKPEEAYLFCAHLEGSGIPAQVIDDATISTDWLLSNAIGGAKVVVPPEFEAQSLEIFREFVAPEIEAAKERNKQKHQPSRYLMIALLVCLVVFAGLVLVSGDFSSASAWQNLKVSLIVSAAIGLLCGVLDI